MTTTQGSSAPRHQGAQGAQGRRQRPRFFSRRKVCSFCVDKIDYIDYRDTEKLRGFVSNHSKIQGKRRTGACSKHQRGIALAIKRARHLALLPFDPRHRMPRADNII